MVSKGDKNISKQNSNCRNLWLLFQYLLSHPHTLISREQVIDDLNFNMELIDAKNALENRIYRLRKMLAVGEKYQTDKYIIFEQGNYGLNWDRTCWSDSIEFENNYKKSEEFLQEEKEQDALNRLMKALEVYKGDYLENLTNYQWVTTRRVKYRQMYLDIFNKTCEILTELEKYQTIEKICRKSIEIYPFEERAHYILIRTMVKQGHKREARSHYDVVKTLFGKQGEEPFPELNKIINQNQDKKQHIIQEDGSREEMNLEDVIREEVNPEDGSQEDINQDDGGQENVSLEQIEVELNLNNLATKITTVSAQDFRRHAQFMQSQQEDTPLFLASIALKINKNEISESQQKRFIEELRQTFESSLRSSDIICQWTNQQFLVLLPSVKAEKVQAILERIKNSFYQLEEEAGSIINIRYRKL